jgi:hypothetical protein
VPSVRCVIWVNSYASLIPLFWSHGTWYSVINNFRYIYEMAHWPRHKCILGRGRRRNSLNFQCARNTGLGGWMGEIPPLGLESWSLHWYRQPYRDAFCSPGLVNRELVSLLSCSKRYNEMAILCTRYATMNLIVAHFCKLASTTNLGEPLISWGAGQPFLCDLLEELLCVGGLRHILANFVRKLSSFQSDVLLFGQQSSTLPPC